ncbi:MAG: biotin/lipoyl-binding protein, partial [Candidatus Doudnabacteria bacterium]
MKKRAKWIMLIIIVLVIGGILAAIFLRPQKQPQYSVEKAARGDLKQTVSINGAVKPQKSLELSFENAGVVKKVNVKVGDEVKAGQPLVQLD